jgi:hypothetical protein
VKLLLDPEALQEARDAAAFYEDSRPGLGKAFLDEVDSRRDQLIAEIEGKLQQRVSQKILFSIRWSLT